MRCRRVLALSSVLLAAFTGGCSEPTFTLPMTANEMASHGSGAALVAYLGQPDASVAVCDGSAAGPHVEALDEDGVEDFVDGLVKGTVVPDTWSACAQKMIKSGSSASTALLLNEMGQAYRELLGSKEIESSLDVEMRLAALHRVYLERKSGSLGKRDVVEPLFEELRSALQDERLGSVAKAYGEELLEAYDAEQGLWRGRTVTEQLLDQRAAAKDERVLLVFAARLPDRDLREEAKRRVLRLRIGTSVFPEVRNNAATVEERVLTTGRNALVLSEHAPQQGRLDVERVKARSIVVRQNVWGQTARLLASSGAGDEPSVVPELTLRNVLFVELDGVSNEVTVCGEASELDPSPCVLPTDVSLDNAFAYRDRTGSFRFVDDVAMNDAFTLARSGERFSMPIMVGGKRVIELVWGLRFERPENLVFGAGAGATGPDLHVAIHEDAAGRLLVVASSNGTYQAVVEGRDAAAFSIGSWGGQGYAGSPGATGSAGYSGSECQDGGPGGPGGNGGDGGPGGDGGNVVVDITCASGDCSGIAGLASNIVSSRAGAGGEPGAGGAGGPGGSGGSAGPSTTTTDAYGNTITVPGCAAGNAGAQGPSGWAGNPGPDGRAGSVAIRVRR